MRRLCIALLAAGFLLTVETVPDHAQQTIARAERAHSIAAGARLREARQSPFDLEIGGELAGVPSGATRFITRDDLLALPQVTYTVADDANFIGPTQISGVPLDTLIQSLGEAPQSEMAVAICDDKYRANYPRDYVAAHHPLLVLTINGQPPPGWPKSVGDQGQDMGPYLISHPHFTPSFKIFSHADEAQIPWGVVRIELRNENSVFGGIRPRGPNPAAPMVNAGYRIAQQNCFRCHNMGAEGGQKSGIAWLVLAKWAATSPDDFAAYVRDPQSKNPHSQMPGNPGYDKQTIGALAAYFRTFIQSRGEPTSSKPEKGKP